MGAQQVLVGAGTTVAAAAALPQKAGWARRKAGNKRLAVGIAQPRSQACTA